MSSRLPSPRWPFVMLAVIALAGGLFCLAGFAMAADSTVADSAHLEHWQTVAKIYLVLVGVALVLLVIAGYALWRRRQQADAPDARAI